MCRFRYFDIDVVRTTSGYVIEKGAEHSEVALSDCAHADRAELASVDVDLPDEALIWSLRVVLAVVRSQSVPGLRISAPDALMPFVRRVDPDRLWSVEKRDGEVHLSFFSHELFPRYFVFELARAADGSMTLAINADNELEFSSR